MGYKRLGLLAWVPLAVWPCLIDLVFCVCTGATCRSRQGLLLAQKSPPPLKGLGSEVQALCTPLTRALDGPHGIPPHCLLLGHGPVVWVARWLGAFAFERYKRPA